MGLFKKKNKNIIETVDGDKKKLYTYVNEEKGFSKEEAQKIQEDFIKGLNQDDESLAINSAAQLLMNGLYHESIEAHQKIMQKYSHTKSDCNNSIGAAYFFLGEFTKAIIHYKIALENGADEGMVEDNIWEAAEANYEKKGEQILVNEYINLYPNGNYKKKASKLLK